MENSIKRKPVPVDRFSTASEIQFANYGAALPNMHRANATAGYKEGRYYKEDPQDPKLDHPLRKKASTFSFVESEEINISEKFLVGHSSKSFASRARANPRDSYGRPLSTVNEDVSFVEGTPISMLPPQTKIMRVRDIVDRSKYDDSSVRMSTINADFRSMEGMPQQLMPSRGTHPALREEKPRRKAHFHEELEEVRQKRGNETGRYR
jgi:hypothetical protein